MGPIVQLPNPIATAIKVHACLVPWTASEVDLLLASGILVGNSRFRFHCYLSNCCVCLCEALMHCKSILLIRFVNKL